MENERNPNDPPVVDADLVVDAEFVADAELVTDAEAVVSPFGATVPGEGTWRDGPILIMHKHATLPDHCVKTNSPAQRRVKRQLNWLPPVLWLSALVPIVYIVVWATAVKKATIDFPVSNAWMKQRSKRLMIGFAILAVALVLLGLSVYGLASEAFSKELSVGLFFLALLIGAISMVTITYCAHVLRPTRITDTHVYLKGAHPSYLDRLPQWQPT